MSASTAPTSSRASSSASARRASILSVLGFGQGNYRDELAQALAQNGNGVAAYIDTLERGAQGAGAGGGLVAVHHRQGREVPGGVQSGHGGRVPPGGLRDARAQARGLQQRRGGRRRRGLGPHGDGHLRDHAGGLGCAHGGREPLLRRSRRPRRASGTANEYGFLKIRYKLPDQDKSQLIEQPISLDTGKRAGGASSATCSSRPRWRASRSCCAAASSPGH